MNLIGYATTGEHRVFGEATEESLRRFQRDRGLLTDGICGPQSWSALVEADYRLGDRLLYYRSPMMRGDDVAELQRQLGRLGFDARWIDGIFGPSTLAAVEQFQQNAGLLPADGVAGRGTVEALSTLASRSSTELTVSEVREHERLRGQPSGIEGRRIIVAHTGELPAVAHRVSQQLTQAGAEVLSLGTPDLRAQAAASNRWPGDAYLGITLADSGFSVSYFATGGFESVGGKALANECSLALAGVLAQAMPAVAMQLPILRETRMPAVWCRVGPGPRVVLNARSVAGALASAVICWATSPLLD